MASDKEKTTIDELDETEEVDAKKSGNKALAKKDGKGKSDDKAADKSKKPSIGKRMGKYLRDSRGEFKKIIWPTRKTVVRNTTVTIAMCAIVGAAVSLFDLGLSALLNLLLSV